MLLIACSAQSMISFRAFYIVPLSLVSTASSASKTCVQTLSISSCLSEGKGLFIANNSTMGCSLPITRTIKFPLPGFSLLISTLALLPIAFAILLALVLNAPHCLQCSIDTTFLSLLENSFVEAGFENSSISVDFVFTTLLSTFFLAGNRFDDDRVPFAMITTNTIL